ncbi:MAG: hypothetical protein H6Q19_1861 [Bacteroidetes bacterium]|nr:hypothetical protein [Bacteroidota bacterium]
MDFQNYPAEPFRIKSVEYVKMNTREEREAVIKKAGFNTRQPEFLPPLPDRTGIFRF